MLYIHTYTKIYVYVGVCVSIYFRVNIQVPIFGNNKIENGKVIKTNKYSHTKGKFPMLY